MADASDIDTTVPPSGTGCVECLAADGWWFHLRRCARCGHIGCCDSSPAQHASKHAQSSGHPLVQELRAGRGRYWDYTTDQYYDGPVLGGAAASPARSAGTWSARPCARDWQQHLH